MTTTEVERLSRILTDMRIENASQFATLHAALSAIPNLEGRVTVLEQAPHTDSELTARVTKLEQQIGAVGRFTWGDVFRHSAAATAFISAAYVVTHW